MTHICLEIGTQCFCLQPSRVNITQESDHPVVKAAVEKTAASNGQLLGQTWKQVHSRIYHAAMDSYKDKGMTLEECKQRASYACANGKVMWETAEDSECKIDMAYLEFDIHLFMVEL